MSLTANNPKERAPEMDGCIRLWASVVRQAAADLFSKGNDATRARLWFASTADGAGSFLWCADALGLDAAAVRESISKGTYHNMKARYAGLLRTHNAGYDQPRDTPKKESDWL